MIDDEKRVDMFGIALITVINSIFIAIIASSEIHEHSKAKWWFGWIIAVFIWAGLFANDMLGSVAELKYASGWLFFIAMILPFILGNAGARLYDNMVQKSRSTKSH